MPIDICELFALYRVNYNGYYDNGETYSCYRTIFKPNVKVGDKLILERMKYYPYDLVKRIESEMISIALTIISLIVVFIFIKSKKKKMKTLTANHLLDENIKKESYSKISVKTIIIVNLIFIILEFLNAFTPSFIFFVIPCEIIILLKFNQQIFLFTPALLLYTFICSALAEKMYPKYRLEILWYFINFIFKLIVVLFTLFVVWRIRKNKE